MNVKDVVELDITGSGMNGEGVARLDGKVVFVPYTLKGERVRAVVKCVKKNYCEASVIKVLQPSAHRTAPACPHYYKCGGCDTCHIDGEYRRELLLSELKNNLKKIAGIDCEPAGLVSAGDTRNKLSMPFGLKDGKVVLGMYRQNTHDVEPVDCMMSGELTRGIARAVCEVANAHGLSVYNGDTGKGLLRHLVVREIAGRASVTLVINGSDMGDAAEKAICKALPECADIFVCPNRRNNNVIMGDSVRLLRGEPKLGVNVLGVRAELSPLSFFQVNDGVRDALYTAAIGEITSPTLIDLYSGIGITSNLAAKLCAAVYAVECVPQAVADADRTAELNGNSKKIHNICGDVEAVLPRIKADIAGEYDVLVDPPRKGCGSAVMSAIAQIKPKKLIYISCNHATMCRDIKLFADAAPGYELTHCAAYDMFPGTHHVETLCVLERK